MADARRGETVWRRFTAALTRNMTQREDMVGGKGCGESGIYNGENGF